jgi:predicted outer membrane protein
MSSKELSASIKIAACICGKDGVISRLEEETIYKLISSQYPEIDKEYFDNVIDEFFDSNEHIEDYLSQINDEPLKKFTLELAEKSASADGLALEENIALKKAQIIWGKSNA